MKPITLEWIDKAEEDWNMAQMGYRARKHPSYGATVFHTQQCAEKYLKAILEEAGLAIQRTHDLLVVHQLALPVAPGLANLPPILKFLNQFAVIYRYPGVSTTKVEAKEALKHCREVRRVVRLHFGFPV